MKPSKSSHLFTLLLIFLSSCATQSVNEPADRKQEKADLQQTIEVQSPQSLADFLVRLPGVYLDERTFPPTVLVRGGPPLFVIDGVPIGNTYASAANILSVHDIRSVELLISPTETMIYGRRAAHGVILIRTHGTATSER